jgi:hypothetical protein
MFQDKDTSNKPLSARPVFWMAIGMLSASSLFTVIISMIQALAKTKFIWALFIPFSYAANTCMYGGFIAAFTTLRREDRRKNPVTSAA